MLTYLSNFSYEAVWPVTVGQIAFEICGEIASRASVRVVLENWRVQVTVTHVAVCAHAQIVLAPPVLHRSECARRVKAAAGQRELPMKTLSRVLQSIDLNNAAHFASVLSRDSCGINAHGLNGTGFNFWAEARRTVIGERDSVHYKLGLIFRATRV